MTDETSKSFARRIKDGRYINRWLVGNGIDIGSGNDPLNAWQSSMPLSHHIRSWDQVDGDAMLMPGVQQNTFDFVHSSHCLEHLRDPATALKTWIRICKPGGYLLIMVPDEDLYEQGIFPSTYNLDHKWTFTIHKTNSWSKKSINIFDLITSVEGVDVLKIELLDADFDYTMQRNDQTLLRSESAIEIVLRKKT